jgi:hypothetical protein
VLPRVRVPLATARVTLRSLLPASTSLIEIWLVPVKAKAISSPVVTVKDMDDACLGVI